MTDISNPKDIIQYAITSSEAFGAVYPEFIRQYTLPSNATKAYGKDFLQAIHDIILSKASPPIQKFHAMYMLMKASDLEDKVSLMIQLVQDNDLLADLFKMAQTDLTKDLHPNDRGMNFFGKSTVKEHVIIGMNLVRLCYETLVHWGAKYGSPEPNDPMHIYHYMAEALKKKGKLPYRSYFIEKNYDLTYHIATCDFREVSPPTIEEREEDELEKQESILKAVSQAESFNLHGFQGDLMQSVTGSKAVIISKLNSSPQSKSGINSLERKDRIVKLDSILSDLKQNNTHQENRTLILDDVENSLDTDEYMTEEESVKLKTQIEASHTGSYHINNFDRVLQDEGDRKTVTLRRDLEEIQMSIKISSDIAKQNKFVRPGFAKLGDKTAEERAKEECLKSIGMRLAKPKAFSKASVSTNPSNQVASQSGGNHEQVKSIGRNLKIGSLDHIDHMDNEVDGPHIDTKSTMYTIRSIAEEKQWKSLNELKEPQGPQVVKKYDPFSKVPIPDLRIPDSYQIKQVIGYNGKGKAKKSIFAVREAGQGEMPKDKMTVYERRIIELEKEAMLLRQENDYLKAGSRGLNTPRLLSVSKPTLDQENCMSARKVIYPSKVEK